MPENAKLQDVMVADSLSPEELQLARLEILKHGCQPKIVRGQTGPSLAGEYMHSSISAISVQPIHSLITLHACCLC